MRQRRPPMSHSDTEVTDGAAQSARQGIAGRVGRHIGQRLDFEGAQAALSPGQQLFHPPSVPATTPVQARASAATPAVPDRDSKGYRRAKNRTAIDRARGIEAPRIAEEQSQALKVALSAKVVTRLEGLRLDEAADRAAHESLSAQIDGAAADDAQRQDARAQLDELSGGAGSAALQNEADTLATAEISPATTAFKKAAERGFDSVSSSAADTASVVAKASAKGLKRAKSIFKAQYRQAKHRVDEKLKSETERASITAHVQANAVTTVGNKGAEEVASRVAGDAQIGAIMTRLHPVVTAERASIEASLLAMLGRGLGASPVGYRRSSEVKAFRAEMKAAALAQLQADAAAGFPAGAEAEAILDAKARAAEGVDANVEEAMNALAAEGAGHAMAQASVEPSMERAGRGAAWKTLRSAGASEPERQAANQHAIQRATPAIREAAARARPAALAQARAWKNRYVKSGATAQRAEAKAATKATATNSGAGADAATATQARQGEVDAIVAAVGSGATVHVMDKLDTYLERRLAATGSGSVMRRLGSQDAADAKQFRDEMKKAGRAQAYADVDAAAAADTSATAGDATKAYAAQRAKGRAYKAAKASVNEALSALAHSGAQTAFAEGQGIQVLNSAARAAAYKSFRSGGDQAAAQLAAEKAMTGAVEQSYAKVKPSASTWANDLIHGSPAAGAAPAGHVTQDAARRQVANKVEGDNVGEKAYKASLSANSAEEGMGILGRLCDTLAPARGDTAKIEVELKIPLGASPGFLLLKVTAEAERGVTRRKLETDAAGAPDSSSLQFSGEFAIGGGVDVWGLQADFSVGFFARAQAMDTAKTMKALSYGCYRSASQLNDSFGKWWATSSSGAAKDARKHSDMSRSEEAELWAAMLEEQVFLQGDHTSDEEDASVDTGISGTGRMKLNAGVLEAEGGIRVERFRHFDAATIRQQLGAQGAGLAIARTKRDGSKAERKSSATARRKALKGEAQNTLAIEAKAKTPFGEVQAGLKVGSDGWEIKLQSGIVFDTAGDSTAVQRVAAGIVGGGLSCARTAVAIYERHKQSAGSQVAGGVGAISDLGQDIAEIANAGLENELGAAMGSAIQVETSQSDFANETMAKGLGADPNALQGPKWNDDKTSMGKKAGVSSETSLNIVITISNGDVSIDITQVKVKKIAADLGPVGLDASVERGRRVARVSREKGGKWAAEAFGLGNSSS